MKNDPSTGSVVFRVCLFFAANPDEELTALDIITKFAANADRRNMYSTFRNSVEGGWLEKRSVKGRLGLTVFSAGPKIHELVGV